MRAVCNGRFVQKNWSFSPFLRRVEKKQNKKVTNNSKNRTKRRTAKGAKAVDEDSNGKI